MTRSQTLAYRCRFVLLVLGPGSFAAAVWLLFLHPGVEGDSLGMGMVGTPLWLIPAVVDRIGVKEYPWSALFILGLLLLVLVWAFGPGLVLLFLREKYRREKLLAGLCPRCGDELVEPPDGPPFCPRCVKGDLGRAGPGRLTVVSTPEQVCLEEERDRTTTRPEVRAGGPRDDDES
jgi:hypothetical protein